MKFINNKEIKIAVQFFGHLRTFETCFPSVKKYLLDVYDCDVFMHTWSQTNHQTHKWGDKNGIIQDVDDVILKRLDELYNPKSIKVEVQSCFRDNIIERMEANGLQSLLPMKYMYHSKMEVNNLRCSYQALSNTVYDYVIMIRPDVCLFSFLNLVQISKQIEMTTPCARFCAFSAKKTLDNAAIGNMMSDILYFATPKIMNKIVTTLNTINFNIKLDKVWNPEVFCCTELLKASVGSYFIPYIHGKDWLLIRSKKKSFTFKSLMNSLVKVNFKRKKRYFSFEIFSFLPVTIIHININIFSKFNIIVLLGKCNNY